MTLAMSSALPDPRYDPAFYDGIPAKRLIAWLVDVAVITVVSLILGLLTLTLLLWVWPLLYLTVAFLYRSGTIGAWSATPGMRLMNVELRSARGLRLTRNEAMMHTGSYIFLSVSMILQLISIGLIAGSARHQGLHDHFLGTALINRPG